MDTPHSRRPPGRASLRARASAGFTLVEVMVASFVMLFAISSSIIVMQSGFKALDTARKTTLAAQIMQSEMERMRMLSWSDISTLVGKTEEIALKGIFPETTEAEKKLLAQMENSFTRVRTVTTLPEFDHQIAEIEVTITWRGIDGVSHSRSSRTRYSETGLYAYYVTGV